MKRIITIGFITILSLSFVSCAAMPVAPANDTATTSDIEEIKKRIDELKKENEQLREEIAYAEAEETEDEAVEMEDEDIVVDGPPVDELFDAFMRGEIDAEGEHEGKDHFNISDLTQYDDWSKYSEKERRDLDNDGEKELYLTGPYGGMILDVRDGKVVLLTEGSGTAEVLSYTDYDNAVWICHSDTTHVGREGFFFDKYNGNGEITDSMSLIAEYYDNPNNHYDENSTFVFNNDNITMKEYEELKQKLFSDVETDNIEENTTKESKHQDSGEQPADGIYTGMLWASNKDKIGTTGYYGLPFAIVYQASWEGNKLYIKGSMEYRIDWEHDILSVSDDITHVFTIDEKTIYQSTGGDGPSIEMSKDEFADYLNKCMDIELGLDITVTNGVVTTISISS